MEPIEKTMPDFRLSLLDADEHLDIKINRFGVSTTHLLYHVESMSYIGGWIVLDGTNLELQALEFQLCAKNLIEVFPSHDYQSYGLQVLIFTTRFRNQSQKEQF